MQIEKRNAASRRPVATGAWSARPSTCGGCEGPSHRL